MYIPVQNIILVGGLFWHPTEATSNKHTKHRRHLLSCMNWLWYLCISRASWNFTHFFSSTFFLIISQILCFYFILLFLDSVFCVLLQMYKVLTISFCSKCYNEIWTIPFLSEKQNTAQQSLQFNLTKKKHKKCDTLQVKSFKSLYLYSTLIQYRLCQSSFTVSTGKQHKRTIIKRMF